MSLLADSPTRRPPPAAPVRLPAPGGRAVSRGVSWTTYLALREEPEYRRVRMTYDGPAGGLLELERPGEPHGAVAELLADLIVAFAEVRRLALRSSGAFTQQRPDLLRGLEGDKAYYIARFDAVRGRAADLAGGDPPPDLCVEVDVTSPGVSKLPIYAALGVPEVWVWAGGAITVRRLTGAGRYETVAASGELAGFPLRLAEGLLDRWADASTPELLAEFRAALAPAE